MVAVIANMTGVVRTGCRGGGGVECGILETASVPQDCRLSLRVHLRRQAVVMAAVLLTA